MPSPSADFPSRDTRESVDRPPETVAPGAVPERRLLDQVLQQTVTALDNPATVSPECLQSLRDVAVRHRGQPVSEPAAAIDLVDAVLKCCWPGWAQNASDRQTMLSEIVEALLEDPTARARLEAVWAMLADSPP
jgi:hypothetical protein